MAYSDDIRYMADHCRRDPAFIMGIAAALRDSGLGEMCGWTPPPIVNEGPPPPFPLPDMITAIQTGVFDNWPQGRAVKGFPSRYGMAIEVWTQAPEKIVIQKGKKPNFKFKAQFALMDSVNLKRQLDVLSKVKRKSPIDPTYIGHLYEVADAIAGTDFRVGMINTNIADDKSGYNRGRYHHAFQYVLVEMTGEGVKSASLRLGNGDGDKIDLPPFTDRDAGGNPLSANVIAQSRDDRCGLPMASWGTNEA